MKKTATAVAVLLLAASMVLPVVRSVNLSAGKCLTTDRILSVDGSPIPPLPPNAFSTNAGTLVADGSPIPPLPPNSPSMEDSMLIVDGSPIPPLPPNAFSTNAGTLVADGSPIPPLPPESSQGLVIA